MKKRPTYEELEERIRVLETESIQGRQSDGAFSQSENQFRAIVESAPEAIHLQRGGRFIYLNRAMLNLLGYSRPEELLGQDCVKHVASEYLDAVAERIRFLQETGKPAPLMEQEYLRRDGSRIAVETTGAAVRIEGGEAYLIFARDITKRKQADEAIRASERKYRQLFENMTEGVALHEMIYNVDGQAVDYRIVETNASYHKHTGISAGPLHDILTTALYGTDTPPYLEEYEEVARTGRPITFETFFPPMNKHFSITVFSPGPGFFATVFEDITELRQSVEALKKSEEQLRDAHRLAHIGVWKWTAETDTVIWTDELYRIAGLDPMLPAPTYAEHSSIYSSESWDLLKAVVERALKTGEPYNLELQLIRPDGATRAVNAFGGAVYDNQGLLQGLFGTVQDITDRKEAEVEKEKLETINRQLQKAESRGHRPHLQ